MYSLTRALVVLVFIAFARSQSETFLASPQAKACIPPAGGSPSKDDTPGIVQTVRQCGDGATISFPANSTYHINSPLTITGCKGCTFRIAGTIKASGSSRNWEKSRCIILFKNSSGLTIDSSGALDGSGQDAWERFAKDKSIKRPALLCLNGGQNIRLTGLKMINPPGVFVVINDGTREATLSNLDLQAKSSSRTTPKNTDGFVVGKSSEIHISNSRVSNQDDCVTFKGGANRVTVDKMTCIGSHGMSIGSLGKANVDTVSNIYVSNAHMIRSTKAAGIKTWPVGNGHGHGVVQNATFTRFKVEDCEYAIQIQACYGEKKEYCASHAADARLTGVVFDDFSGTTNKKFRPVTSSLNCGKGGRCDVKVSKYAVRSSSGEGKVLCSNTPSTLGLKCGGAAV